MAKGKKQARAKSATSDTKQPTQRAVATPGDQPIVWGFSHLDLDGTWSWLNFASADHRRRVLEVLGQLEARTWGALQGSGSVGTVKHIPIEHLCKEAQDRLDHLKRDDLDALWEIRIGGKQRVWGAREGAVFRLLWWDPDHEVCPSSLRRT